MVVEEIHKSSAERERANLPDYDAAYGELGWDTYRSWLDYLPGGALNIAYEALDRHVAKGPPERKALRWISRSGEKRTYSDAHCQESQTSR